MDGATALVKMLEKQGVEYIFGYSGGAAIPIFDAIITSKTKIKLILVRHEQGATHMADGYARATGKPGVVLVTSGPGAGNTITGLMTASMDSVPVIVISGQQILPMLGKDAFQEADVFDISMPVVKHNYLVRETNDIPRVVSEAFTIATTGRPGPVLIDIPKDVSSGSFTGSLGNISIDLPGYQPISIPENRDLAEAAAMINKSKQPIILAGHGAMISGAEDVYKRQRANFGQALNALRSELEQKIIEQEAIANAEKLGPIDVTAPFDTNVAQDKKPRLLPAEQGNIHPVNSELKRILSIFSSMGFSVIESRQLDDDYHMFTSLNFPDDHPARDDYDTFMTTEGLVAPAHTSVMQNRILQSNAENLKKGEQIAYVIPGRTFRNEDLDPRHEHTFHQLEGVFVGKGITVGDLIGTFKAFLETYYERELSVRINPFYFPFTEPSFCLLYTSRCV